MTTAELCERFPQQFPYPGKMRAAYRSRKVNGLDAFGAVRRDSRGRLDWDLKRTLNWLYRLA